MNEECRCLLYPLGFIAQGLFALRFLIQWLAVEKTRHTTTPKLFWQLSIVGNFLLFIHSLIQLQFPMSLVQSQNIVLSWRNINLQQQKKTAFWKVLVLLFMMALATFVFFALRSNSWIAAPHVLNFSFGIHFFGIVGIICFALRFWVQWWQMESQKTQDLTKSFWWISLAGAFLSGMYFFIVQDWVNFIGPVLSLIPYGRNLYFLKKA